MGIREHVGSLPVDVAETVAEDAWRGVALIAPAMLLLVVTIFYPFLEAVQLSFLNVSTGEFVALEHYQWLVGQQRFWPILGRSIAWTVANVLLQGLLGVTLALLLYESFPGRDTVRTALLVPFVIPTAVTAVLWRWLFNGTYGPINTWLQNANLIQDSITPLTNPDVALAFVTVINSWRWAPLVALIVFAVLQTIPREEYEAAELEGAGRVQTFYHVTYPHLKSALSVLGLLGFLITFNVFDIVWLLTSGGPGDATTTLPVFVYEVAFRQQAIGRGTAVSVVLFLILLAFVLLLFRRSDLGAGGERA